MSDIKFLIKQKKTTKLNKKPQPNKNINIDIFNTIIDEIKELTISDNNSDIEEINTELNNMHLNNINENKTKKIKIEIPFIERGRDIDIFSDNILSHPSKNKPFLKHISNFKITQNIETPLCIIISFYISNKPFCSHWNSEKNFDSHFDLISSQYNTKKYHSTKTMYYYDVIEKDEYTYNNDDNYVKINDDFTFVLRITNKINKDARIKCEMITHIDKQKNIYLNKNVKDPNMAWILHLIFNDRYFSQHNDDLYFFYKDTYIKTSFRVILYAYYKVVSNTL